MAIYQRHDRKLPFYITFCRTVIETDCHLVARVHLIRHPLTLLHVIVIIRTVVDQIIPLGKLFCIKFSLQQSKILTFMVKIIRIHTGHGDRIISPFIFSGKSVQGIPSPLLFHAFHISLPVTGQFSLCGNLST